MNSKDFSTIYNNLIKEIVLHGKKKPCRFAHENVESIKNPEEILYINDVVFTIENPKSCRLLNPIRKPSHKIGFIEGVMLCDDSDEIKYMPWYKPFSRDGVHSLSMYGQWINPYARKILNKLVSNPNTRQCQFSIYNSELNDWDNDITDVPCTTCGIFDIEDGGLNLTIFMRSNDLYLGTPYNVQMFCYLLQVYANTLNLKIGTYTHIVHNLHIYKRNVDELLKAQGKYEPALMNIKYDYDTALCVAKNYKFCIDEGQDFDWKYFEALEV